MQSRLRRLLACVLFQSRREKPTPLRPSLARALLWTAAVTTLLGGTSVQLATAAGGSAGMAQVECTAVEDGFPLHVVVEEGEYEDPVDLGGGKMWVKTITDPLYGSGVAAQWLLGAMGACLPNSNLAIEEKGIDYILADDQCLEGGSSCSNWVPQQLPGTDAQFLLLLNSPNIGPGAVNGFVLEYAPSTVTSVTVNGRALGGARFYDERASTEVSRRWVVNFTYNGENFTFTAGKDAGSDSLNGFRVNGR